MSKCTFCSDTVEYLGHVVSNKEVFPDLKKIERVVKMAVPTNVSEVRSFLGLTGYYWRFIYCYAEVASLLSMLMKTEVPFVWTDGCQTAFETLKQKLVTLILIYLDFSKPFIL